MHFTCHSKQSCVADFKKEDKMNKWGKKSWLLLRSRYLSKTDYILQRPLYKSDSRGKETIFNIYCMIKMYVNVILFWILYIYIYIYRWSLEFSEQLSCIYIYIYICIDMYEGCSESFKPHLDFWLVWFGLVWFYSISTFVGYLMPNPFLCK